MRLNRLVLVAAPVVAILLVWLSGCPASQKPPVVDAGHVEDGSKPFPPPPVEIEPGGDAMIQWTRGNPTKLLKADGEAGTMITDELTWKVTDFVVKEKANNQIHTNV